MEIIEEEMVKRLNNYESGSDYTPLQIVMEIIPPIFITSPWLNLDSILTYLCVRDALGDLFYIMPSDHMVDVSNISIPLLKTDEVYHSSVGQYDQAKLYKNTIYKRFTDKETYHLTKKQQKGRVKTNSGHFKDFMIDLPIILTNTITFYCNGDKEEIRRLLHNFTQIGKKTSIGGGRVNKIKISETEEDYSFFKDGKIMRPIPVSMKIPVAPGMNFSRQAYKPPYWSKSNVTMCYTPENAISF